MEDFPHGILENRAFDENYISFQRNKRMRTAVLGCGAWGTTLAKVLAENGHAVSLWCHDAEISAQIREQRENQNLLPGILSKNETIKMILLEDGMIAAPSEIDILVQLNLLKKLSAAGVRVRPVYNYDYSLEGAADVDRLVQEIKNANTE